jgi:hypothetical protein
MIEVIATVIATVIAQVTLLGLATLVGILGTVWGILSNIGGAGVALISLFSGMGWYPGF